MPARKNPYLTPESEAMLASEGGTPVRDVADDVAPAAVEEGGPYPVVYANPFVIDEQFSVMGSPYRARFVNGRFVATTPEMEQSVRAALAAYGRDKAERWKGEDRSREYVCPKCGFRSFLDQAKYDHEWRHGH